jgi:16S rRNA (uracil1498-N3)-methyltransferase
VYLDEFDGNEVLGEAARHLKSVLRLKPGEAFAGYDGAREWIFRAERVGAGAVAVKVESVRDLPTAPGRAVILAPALIKGQRWDWLLEKSVEMGVGAIAPVAAERSVVRVAAEDVPDRLARWRRILGSAAAQCAGRMPEISGPVALGELLKGAGGIENKYILAKRPGAAPLAELVRSAAPGRIVLLIGPEGDWTEREAAEAEDAGFDPATLGPLILRSETAALAAAATVAAAAQREDV